MSFDLLRELFGLVFLIERPNQLIEIAVHDVVELVEREIDAMIGDAPLRKIVGADALGAVARARPGACAIAPAALCCFSRSAASSRAFSSDMARERFLCCERSSWHSTTMPVGSA